MRRLEVALGARSYPILIGSGLLGTAQSYAAFAQRPKRIVCDENVARHYLPAVLDAAGLTRAEALVVPPGEAQKTWASAGVVLEWLLSSRLPRDGALLALGGGVIGDLAGFCAAVYQRGIDFVQLPTTLLAQVDSSVGGKTAVNHALGKNMLGAFHQPRVVIADTGTLKTLPVRELRAGLAEVIKYAMLGDAAFFGWLEQNLEAALALDPETVGEIVARCCEMKVRIVAADEREALAGGPRTLLNLGHTFAHAIETHVGYSGWLHGEAVAVGLCMAADLSARLGFVADDVRRRCRALIERAGLPTAPPSDLDPARFLELMGRDKKVAAGRLRLVLLRGLGDAVVTADVAPALLDATLRAFCAPTATAAHG